eukprot:768194-Hanusia_phi.AAC.7
MLCKHWDCQHNASYGTGVADMGIRFDRRFHVLVAWSAGKLGVFSPPLSHLLTFHPCGPGNSHAHREVVSLVEVGELKRADVMCGL